MILPRLESALELLDWTGMPLRNLVTPSASPSTLSSARGKKFTRSQFRAVRRLGHHRGLFMEPLHQHHFSSSRVPSAVFSTSDSAFHCPCLASIHAYVSWCAD
ncbi:hypothetical protein J6590_042102 [Homalodisca vitripennis]|nr:hypothetical protein J6590_088055 [Homalodisca vitripennis]KAG8336583.1 hypothetical protein J6590_042102 [Homalodisca vitripennis]